MNLYNKIISKNEDIVEKQKVIQTLVDKYIKSGAPMELNVSSSTASKVHSLMIQGVTIENEAEWKGALELVLHEVKFNLQDTFSRFILSKTFQHYYETVQQK